MIAQKRLDEKLASVTPHKRQIKGKSFRRRASRTTMTNFASVESTRGILTWAVEKYLKTRIS